MIGIALPVLFIVALELIRLPVVNRLWPDRGHLILGVLSILAAAVFGIAIFFFIDRAYRLILRQNHQLAVVNAVSTAVRGKLGVDQIIDAALEGVLSSTGATEVALTAAMPADRLLNEDAVTWHRVATADAPSNSIDRPTATPPRTVDVPLLAGAAVVGVMSLRLVDSDEPGRLTSDTLQHIGQQVGSAIRRAQLIADLQRRKREDQAIYQILLQISSQGSPTATLASVVDSSRDLLDADEAGLCLNQAISGLVLVDTTANFGAASDGLACIAGEGAAQACGLRSMTCPIRTPSGYPVTVSVPLHGPGGLLGQVWVARRSDNQFSRRDERFLVTLSELAVVALNHARMLENERQGAILAERERIAREMHDSLAQVLGVTQLRLRALVSRPDLSEATEVQVELTDLIGICHEAYYDVREAILGLRESSRTDRALLESLRAYAEKFSRQSRIETTLDSALDGELVLTPQCEVQVIRVIQEALTNVRKHSGARSAVIRISETPELTMFVVEDDGHGFESGTVPAEREGFGLLSMRERIELVNGRLTIDSMPGRGTRIIVGVPRSHRVLPLPLSAVEA
ncbi:sensor histidine kinase [Micromonospora polyrhachis]|uniref:Two-component system nitrate/nitrite sensor histidine kinase NarX n=1 Tax=Micromonospora polyrhachis TaxID=1282883 RepID=A0A7W7WNU2_9ACTN|nr:GAF domain-containing sensor histidine kinase [Micromonospora polyrhachis]MBB4957934.1 two-component system nitrate/nitrite sensor histidine kinase NarX [Micromonospora polyrhachis]